MKQIDKIKQMRRGRFSWRILGENFVFHEGEHFYKMPTFLAKNVMYRQNDSHEKVSNALNVITKYFGALTKIPKTKILKDIDGHYVIQQQNILGEKLTRKLLENKPKLLSKFKRIIIANEIMWLKEGVFLDLLGSDIVIHPQTIHNLLTDGENIYIFDFGLLEKKSKNVFFRYFSHFAQKFQLLFMKMFF